MHCGDDVIEELGEADVADQRLGELEEPSRVLLATTRLIPCRVELGDDPGHDEHHDEINDQGKPVGGGVDGQGAVRGKEEDVVKEEPDDRGHGAGRETADHHAYDHGNHEDQGGRGDAEVRADRQQHGQQHALRGQGGGHTHHSTPVCSVEGLHARHRVRHNFPGKRDPVAECTDPPTR